MNFGIALLLIESALVVGALSNIIFIKRLFNIETREVRLCGNRQPSPPLFPPKNIKFYHVFGCEAILIVLFLLVLATYDRAGIGESPLLAIFLSLGGLILGWVIPIFVMLVLGVWFASKEESSSTL